MKCATLKVHLIFFVLRNVVLVEWDEQLRERIRKDLEIQQFVRKKHNSVHSNVWHAERKRQLKMGVADFKAKAQAKVVATAAIVAWERDDKPAFIAALEAELRD